MFTFTFTFDSGIKNASALAFVWGRLASSPQQTPNCTGAFYTVVVIMDMMGYIGVKTREDTRKKHICFGFQILFNKNRTFVANRRVLGALNTPKVHL